MIMQKWMDARVIRAFTPVFDGLCPRMTEHIALSHPSLELPGLAEAPQIGRDHDRDRGRVDAETRERAVLRLGGCGYDIVAPQQLDLIGRQQRLGEKLQELRLEPREPE